MLLFLDFQVSQSCGEEAVMGSSDSTLAASWQLSIFNILLFLVILIPFILRAADIYMLYNRREAIYTNKLWLVTSSKLCNTPEYSVNTYELPAGLLR